MGVKLREGRVDVWRRWAGELETEDVGFLMYSLSVGERSEEHCFEKSVRRRCEAHMLGCTKGVLEMWR